MHPPLTLSLGDVIIRNPVSYDPLKMKLLLVRLLVGESVD
jgi:hypothetical protein